MRVKAIDCLDQPEARDLEEVLDRLVGTAVAERELARERHKPPYELVARPSVTVRAPALEELGAPLIICRSADRQGPANGERCGFAGAKRRIGGLFAADWGERGFATQDAC